MCDWRLYAANGEWSSFDHLQENDVPKAEWGQLVDVLKMVVPIVVRGNDLEHVRDFATCSDTRELRQHIREKKYAAALKEVAAKLDISMDVTLSPQEQLRREREKPPDTEMRQLRMLAAAATMLEDLSLLLEDNSSHENWMNEPKQAAVEILERKGIQWKETAVLEELVHQDAENVFSEEWLASRILIEISALKLKQALVLQPGRYRPGKKTVVRHMNEAAEIAYGIGVLSRALWNKPFDRDTRRGIGTMTSSALGGTKRKGALSHDTPDILHRMDGLIQKGESKSQAAKNVFKLGLGSSAEANRQLYYDHQKKKL